MIQVDIAYIANFSGHLPSWIASNEVRINSAAGKTTALVHIPPAGQEERLIHPDIQSCVEEGLASAVDFRTNAIQCELAILVDTVKLFEPILHYRHQAMPKLVPQKVVSLAFDDAFDQETFVRANVLLRSVFASELVWTSFSDLTLQELASAELPVTSVAWAPVALSDAGRPVWFSFKRKNLVFGCAGDGAVRWWEAMSTKIGTLFRGDSDPLFRLLFPREADVPAQRSGEGWEIISSENKSLQKFCRHIDVYFTGAPDDDDRRALIPASVAMANGVPVLASGKLGETLGTRLRCGTEQEFRNACRDLRSADGAYTTASADSTTRSARNFSVDTHLQRISSNSHVPSGTISAARPRTGSAARPVLFVSTNGTGVGHLTRLLSIAKRIESPVRPIIATMSGAFGIARQTGYETHYLPFFDHARYDLDTWNDWLADEICRLADENGAYGLVFDGPTPYPGIIAAMARLRSLTSVWVRRGFWRTDQTTHGLEQQRFFDLILEPGDLAGSFDEGPTTRRKSGALTVAPIRYLDRDEYPTRMSAAKTLGLDPDGINVLIQLGGGTNRDILTTIDTAIGVLNRLDAVTAVIADWNISTLPAALWPEAPRLVTFPIQYYYPAFDFTISACGYNAFTDIITYGLPAIFVPNSNQLIDDQRRRAMYAESEGAAVLVDQNDTAGLDLAIRTLVEPASRLVLSSNCGRLANDRNGALVAANMIKELVA